MEVFDPSTDEWSAGLSSPSEVNRGTAITINNKIYLIGGYNLMERNMFQFQMISDQSATISIWISKYNDIGEMV